MEALTVVLVPDSWSWLLSVSLSGRWPVAHLGVQIILLNPAMNAPVYAVNYAARYYPKLPTEADEDFGFVQPGERVLLIGRKTQNLCTVRFPDRRDAGQYFMYCSRLVNHRVSPS
jgi:hypothetical protein